jgi:glycosyltransferase involved in cell wall biosynthesis|tara:strand:+ start:589 stop:1530 length:942 start_codon:yes stop_codon:yes gene_type:complete
MEKNKPQGGTELQLAYLHKYVDKELLDKVQITTSIPGKIPLSKDKPNILWQKNSWDQPNIHPWFSKPDNHKQYDWYVFNSHWNYNNFVKFYKLPAEKCVVIKNGIDNIKPRDKVFHPKRDKCRIIHHCTPWRGLNVLLGAMELIKDPMIELDVFSSCEVYGKDFADAHEKKYQPLYDHAKKLPNVNYLGFRNNEWIKKHLKNYNMFVYPSIWEETFCISLLESMAAGLYCIVSNYGALPETGAEFPMYVTHSNNHHFLARKVAIGIESAKKTLDQPAIQQHLARQVEYANTYYNWPKIAITWTHLLKGILNGK